MKRTRRPAPKHQTDSQLTMSPTDRVQPLAAISEATAATTVPDSRRAAGRSRVGSRATTRSHRHQNDEDPTARRYRTCPPIKPPPPLTRPTYTTPLRSPTRSTHKEPEIGATKVTAVRTLQQKPEAYDSGLDSDAAATRAVADHQSLPVANVDLQKVKDVLENPTPSRVRAQSTDDSSDENRGNETTGDIGDVTVKNSSSVERIDDGDFERDNTARQTEDSSRCVSFPFTVSTLNSPFPRFYFKFMPFFSKDIETILLLLFTTSFWSFNAE